MTSTYSKMTPAEVDNILVEAIRNRDEYQLMIDRAIQHLDIYRKRLENYKELAENGFSAKTRKEYLPKLRGLEVTISETTEKRRENEEARKLVMVVIREINAEFDSRGGWNRFWIVDNTNGHIHHNRQCSSCFPTTVFAWLPDQSGMRSTDLVELAGEKACTVCFPDAPVSALNRPSLLEAPDRKKQREEREAKKLERQRVLAEKNITAPDGISKLMIPGEHWAIKTVNEALRILTSNLSDKLAVAAGYREVRNPAYEEEKEQQNIVLLEALAHKFGKSREELMVDYNARAERKFKRDWKNFRK